MTYVRLPEFEAVQTMYLFSMHPFLPLIASSCYIVGCLLGNFKNRHLRHVSTTAKVQVSTQTKMWMMLHNVAMMIFSTWIFSETIFLVGHTFFIADISFVQAVCDEADMMYKQGMGWYTWLFYLSKYYEIMDSYILFKQGKQISLLQMFHHSGSIWAMWLLTTNGGSFSWPFTVLNSGVHAVMYYYYTLTTIGFHPQWKQWVTRLQIAQFCMGGSIGLLFGFFQCQRYEFNPDDAFARLLGWNRGDAQMLCNALTLGFVGCLIVMFTHFSNTTYCRK